MNLRELERESIRAFVHSAADDGYLSGTVLDYGCGRGPYRRIVEEHGGIYYGFDRVAFPGNVSEQDVGELLPTYESVLCTQVSQFVPGPRTFVAELFGLIKSGGHLVMTYVTNWPEVEPGDLHRHTKAGMEALLVEAGFTVVRHERRTWVRVATGVWETDIQPDEFALGYGVVARA